MKFKNTTLRITNLLFAAASMLLLFMAAACERDEELPVRNTGGCDTNNVSFARDVLPMFNTSCNACHASSIAKGGSILDNYQDAHNDAVNGKLMNSITPGHPKSMLSYFPDECSVNMVRAWINKGAPNN